MAAALTLAAGLFLIGHAWEDLDQREASPARKFTRPDSIEIGSRTKLSGIAAGSTVEIGNPDSPDEFKWDEYFVRENAYAAVLELNALRQPGSHARAIQLASTCFAAWAALSRNVLRDQTSTPNYHRRLLAENRLRSRCEAFNNEGALRFTDLQPNDGYGERFLTAREAARVSVANPSFDVDRYAAALKELASQGLLLSHGLSLVSMAKLWNGRSWRDRPEVFASAVLLVRERVGPAAGTDPLDTRRLLLCYSSGRCEAEPYAMPPSLSARDQADARTVAAEMEAALRRGNYRAFLGERVDH